MQESHVLLQWYLLFLILLITCKSIGSFVLAFTEESQSYRSGMTWKWVNEDRIFFFVWLNYSFNRHSLDVYWNATPTSPPTLLSLVILSVFHSLSVFLICICGLGDIYLSLNKSRIAKHLPVCLGKTIPRCIPRPGVNIKCN